MTNPRPAAAPPPRHSDDAHDAITAELQRLTLGGRGPERPELLVAWRRFALAVQRLGKALGDAGMALTAFQRSWIGAVAAAQEAERIARLTAAAPDLPGLPVAVVWPRQNGCNVLAQAFFDEGREDGP